MSSASFPALPAFFRSFLCPLLQHSSFPSRPLIQSTSRVHEKRGSHLSTTLGVTKRGKSKKTEYPAIVATFSSSGSERDILVPHEHVTLAQCSVKKKFKKAIKIFTEVIKFERKFQGVEALSL